jgi:large subunit ribosomal protein L17
MRHRIAGKKLGRSTAQRNGLEKNLTIALFKHGRITTTRAKADFVRGSVERMITLAKRGIAKQASTGKVEDGVHARRLAASRLYNDREIVQRLFDVIAPAFATRPGGYTRIYRLDPRKGDNADMVILELVGYQEFATTSADA